LILWRVMTSKGAVLKLYRQLLHEAKKFSNYNFREYSIRRVRQGFHENILEKDPQKITSLINNGNQNLEVLRRQTVINAMYDRNPLIVEVKDKLKPQK